MNAAMFYPLNLNDMLGCFFLNKIIVEGLEILMIKNKLNKMLTDFLKYPSWNQHYMDYLSAQNQRKKIYYI